jgi:hypothetical protein
MSMFESSKEGEGKLAEVCHCGLLHDPRRISNSVMLMIG